MVKTRIGINFIISAVMNERVKKVIEGHIQGGISAVLEYEIGSKVYMVIVEKKNPKDNRLVEKYMVFVTNMKFDSQDEMINVIPEVYKYRWDIETSYRVEDGFEAKTISRNFMLRTIYFMFATLLYNAWNLARIESIQAFTAYIMHIVEKLITIRGPPG
ncbi:MAG: hypothetical protein ACP5U0_09190 [Caldisphaera sp.]